MTAPIVSADEHAAFFAEQSPPASPRAEALSIPPENYFAPGGTAEYQYGVMYQAEWETEWDGTAVAARLHARALAAQGIPVLLKSFSGVVVNEEGIPEPVFMVGLPDSVKTEIQGLNETSIATLAIIIRHMVVRSGPTLERLLIPRHAIDHDVLNLISMRNKLYASTIAYTVWERDRVSTAIAAQLARVGQAWVPCHQNMQMLIRSGVPAEKVRVVPHPYEVTDPICRLTARPRPYPEKRFYAIGRWEPRKGFHELVGAFMQAFRPSDTATLTIKTSASSWQGYPSPAESIEDWLKVYDYWTADTLSEHLVIDSRRYPRSRILKLHFDNNIYVLPSHGEAWGLPGFESKLAGNRLVHVAYGGSADYAETEDLQVPFVMEPDHPSYGWEAGAQWAGFTIDALAHALSKVMPPTAFVRPAHYERVFSLDAVGRQMAALVLEQAAMTDPKAAAYLRGRARA